MPNEAFARRDILRTKPARTIGLLLEHWLSLQEDRQSWVALEDRAIRGLISVEQEGAVYEIDRLLLAADGGLPVVQRLLSYTVAAASENGIQKVFLRVPNECDLAEVATSAGFVRYNIETLYTRRGPDSVRFGEPAQPPAEEAPERTTYKLDAAFWDEVLAPLTMGPTPEPGPKHHGPVVIRAKASADDHGIFQVYSAAVPSMVRQAEAMLLGEWQELRQRMRPASHRRELVAERDGRVVGWVQTGVRSGAGQISLLVHPEHEDCLEQLVDQGLAYLGGRAPIMCLVAEHEVRLARVLGERGFTAEASFCALVKQLSVRVREPRLVPVQA